MVVPNILGRARLNCCDLLLLLSYMQNPRLYQEQTSMGAIAMVPDCMRGRRGSTALL